MRVLIVEDDPDLSGLLADLFALRPHAVESSDGAAMALARLSKEYFDLVLLDLDLDELDGFTVQRALRDFSEVPTIAMSGRETPWMADALRAGATACVEKPFAAGPLLRLTDGILNADQKLRGWPADVRRLSERDLRRLRRMSNAKLDALPFGVIRVDGEGRIRAFNVYEAEAAGEHAPSVLGLRFSALAPCTKVKSFVRLMERAGEGVDEVLRFVFPRHGASALVSVRVHSEKGGPTWIFVSQRRD